MSHTPTPWMVMDLRTEGKEQLSISGQEPNQIVARIVNTVSGRPIDAEDEANAKLIVDAVNSYATSQQTIADPAGALKECNGQLARIYEQIGDGLKPSAALTAKETVFRCLALNSEAVAKATAEHGEASTVEQSETTTAQDEGK